MATVNGGGKDDGKSATDMKLSPEENRKLLEASCKAQLQAIKDLKRVKNENLDFDMKVMKRQYYKVLTLNQHDPHVDILPALVDLLVSFYVTNEDHETTMGTLVKLEAHIHAVLRHSRQAPTFD